MMVTIAAAARARIVPYVEAAVRAGVHSVAIFASPPVGGCEAPPIKVLEQAGQQKLPAGLIRRILITTIFVVGVISVGALTASYVIGARLDEQQRELARRVASARVAARAAQSAASSSVANAERRLDQRKHEIPSTIVVLDNLARILPDHTYVTELRIEGQRLRISGVTQDAPSLIGLLEQSGQFGQASFFAPTTRSTLGPGEDFHIEANLRSPV
jgi:general secretion pathway protein L